MRNIPLTELRPGQRAVISYIDAGRGATRRLLDLGITPGEEIEVLQSFPFRGPIKIRVRGTELAIGRGIAMKIFVEAP